MRSAACRTPRTSTSSPARTSPTWSSPSSAPAARSASTRRSPPTSSPTSPATSPPAPSYTPIANPTRILDTRNGTGGANRTNAAGGVAAAAGRRRGRRPGQRRRGRAQRHRHRPRRRRLRHRVALRPAATERLQPQLRRRPDRRQPRHRQARHRAARSASTPSRPPTSSPTSPATSPPAPTTPRSPTPPASSTPATAPAPAPAPDAAGGTLQLQVGGVAGVPANAAAAVLNVTVTNPAGAGFVTVYPCGQPRPNASNLNYVAGQNVPNLVIAKLGTGGKVCIYTFAPTDLIADVAGYFPAGADYAPIPNPTRILDTRNGTGSASAAVGGIVPVHARPTCPSTWPSARHFDAPDAGHGGRTGDLDPSCGASLARTRSPTASQGRRTTSSGDVGRLRHDARSCPPHDVRDLQRPAARGRRRRRRPAGLAMYPKQPFDIAGRTGHGRLRRQRRLRRPARGVARVLDHRPARPGQHGRDQLPGARRSGQNTIRCTPSTGATHRPPPASVACSCRRTPYSEPAYSTPACIAKPQGYPGPRR